jgi:ABC-type phosphate transport system substrate-binding protein
MLAGVALGCFGISNGANAQQVFGGGSTFAAPTYRLLMDCWGLQADGVGADHTIDTGIVVPPISSSCSSSTGDKSGLTAQILFAPTGSGGGKQALANHDPSTNTSTGLKTPSGSNTIPFTSTFYSSYPYITLQFAGSDDPWLASDAAIYTATGGPAKYGKILQFPAWAGAATISFNGKDGAGAALNIVNATPTGGSSGLNLSRQAVCGIFSGHITKWNNPILTALNGGTVLGTGQISVVHRSDGSGTTFITTNGLEAQCANQFGPNNETDSSLVLYELPWSDRVVSTSQCNAVAPKSSSIPFEGSDLLNWPDLVTDQCGTAITNPTGAVFVNGNGNSGVVAKIQATNGAIGYATTDYTQPVIATGPRNANLQNQYDLDNGTGTFNPPTAGTVTAAMDSDVPFFPPIVTESEDIANPLNWSRLAINANPVLPGAYPLSGFTFMDFYQCLKSTNTAPLADSNNLNVIFSYLTFQYTDANAAAIISANGFANISPTNLSNWYNAAVTLLSSGTSAMNNAGVGACSAVSPGA